MEGGRESGTPGKSRLVIGFPGYFCTEYPREAIGQVRGRSVRPSEDG